VVFYNSEKEEDDCDADMRHVCMIEEVLKERADWMWYRGIVVVDAESMRVYLEIGIEIERFVCRQR
jgi:hypothetical protein